MEERPGLRSAPPWAGRNDLSGRERSSFFEPERLVPPAQGGAERSPGLVELFPSLRIISLPSQVIPPKFSQRQLSFGRGSTHTIRESRHDGCAKPQCDTPRLLGVGD